MMNSRSAGKRADTLLRFLEHSALPFCPAGLRLHRSANEPREQRMRARWTRLKLRMELASHEPRMSLQLDDLDQRSVGRKSAEREAVFHKGIAICVGDLVTMAMALTHLRH